MCICATKVFAMYAGYSVGMAGGNAKRRRSSYRPASSRERRRELDGRDLRTRPLRSLAEVPADEVCGCPLVRDVFELTGDFCRLPKRQCNRHYCWEKLRRAEVDLERVRVVGFDTGCGWVQAGLKRPFLWLLMFSGQWYKLDELFEQERNVRTAMTNRAGLLALMLHQTIQHDPLTTDLRSSADR
ncbi:CpG-binding protein [Tupaia chinensis]|uniref:CXXC-type zinc finger protein 1 n=1 Tax=Tupaia chinensis TaxID=246437 RepID=L9L3N1_TUPCH|nr:CpG-binding protein [Tupaia chinensis]